VHVPYKGAGPAVQAVVAGEAAATITSPAAVLGFIRDGRLRALAIGAKSRSPLLPDVPTLTEAGGDDDTLVPTYFAFALPARTPPAIVQRLSETMRSAVKSPEVAERLDKAGLEPTGGTGAELLELVKSDIARFHPEYRHSTGVTVIPRPKAEESPYAWCGMRSLAALGMTSRRTN
jgi:tripartite-type tricarboxylate transporter receptor subunit TctC